MNLADEKGSKSYTLADAGKWNASTDSHPAEAVFSATKIAAENGTRDDAPVFGDFFSQKTRAVFRDTFPWLPIIGKIEDGKFQ